MGDSAGIRWVDLQLSHITYEMYYLDYNHRRIEEQIQHLTHKAGEEVRCEYGDLHQLDKGELSLARSDLHQLGNVIIPRLVRNSFLVSVYAVYETTVIEIAGFIRAKPLQPDERARLRGRFPYQARKYYKEVLGFELSRNDESWEMVCDLTRLRHAIAHANGRLYRLRSAEERRQIENIPGIDVGGPDLMIIRSRLLADIVVAVKGELEDLVSRYKDWVAERQNEG